MLIQLGNDTVTVSKRLWAFAQFSRFVKPGAVRIRTTSASRDIHVSAFENSNGVIAVQVINTNEAEREVDLAVAGASGAAVVRSWLTNESNDLTARNETLIRGGLFNSTVPARSIVSFVISKTAARF